VVTAGHCVADAVAARITVTLGEYTITGFGEPLPAREAGVRKVYKHPYYRFTPQADRYDVAVLKLDRFD
jgi:hypothetical protein